MRVTHPHADRDASPAAVTVGSETYPVDSDGVIGCPDSEARAVAAALAVAHGCDAADLRVSETCDVVKSDGEVCGRGRPCPYHDEGE